MTDPNEKCINEGNNFNELQKRTNHMDLFWVSILIIYIGTLFVLYRIWGDQVTMREKINKENRVLIL